MPFIDPVTNGSTTSWTTPYELDNATLARNNTTNKYTLHLPAGVPSQPGKDLTLTFDSTGKLTTLADQAGHTITQSYYSGGAPDWPTLHGITDTNNAAWTVSRGSLDEERIADILSPDNHHTTFGYLTSGRYLNQVTEADGTTNKYGYDSSKRITSITTPDGNVTKITYDGSSTRIASLIRTTDTAHTTGPTTTLTYSSPTAPCQSTNFDYQKTIVHRPDNSSTTYCANDHAQVTYDTDNPTAATPSGEWYDLHDQYTQATGTHSITIAAADAGAGVKKLSLQRGSGTEIAATTVVCDPRNAQNPTACPHTVTANLTFDPSAIPEGTQPFRAVTTDYAGRTTASAAWSVLVDRTGPTAPDGFDATYEPDTTRTLVTWNPSSDPGLPDGNNGAGVVSYNYRYQIGSGLWSDWLNITAPWFGLTGATAGQVINVQVQAVDAVGNVGPLASGSTTNMVSTLSPDDVGQADPGESGDAPLDPEPNDLPRDPAPADDLARRRHNFNYRYFGGSGGDCTNFASQALKAGGTKYMRAHGRNSPDASTIGTNDFMYGEGSWWSWYTTSTDPDPVTSREYGSTDSFARAPKLFHHLIDYGLAEIVPHNGHIRAGTWSSTT